MKKLTQILDNALLCVEILVTVTAAIILFLLGIIIAVVMFSPALMVLSALVVVPHVLWGWPLYFTIPISLFIFIAFWKSLK